MALSGTNCGAQWLGSRVIYAQKANTANAYSLDSSSDSNGSGQPNGLSLSTANLYSGGAATRQLVRPRSEQPVNTDVAYRGPAANYGTANDPMVGGVIGSVKVFGGGLALYAAERVLVGGVGVSGDTPSADHMIAGRCETTWTDHLAGVGGVNTADPSRPDNIIYDIQPNPNGGTGIGGSGGFSHPTCINTGDPTSCPPCNNSPEPEPPGSERAAESGGTGVHCPAAQ